MHTNIRSKEERKAHNDARVAKSLSAAAANPSALLTTQAVMALCGIGRNSLYRWVEIGRLPKPVLKLGPGGNRWSSAEVNAALAKLKAEPQA